MSDLLQRNLATIQPELLQAFEGTALVRHYRKGIAFTGGGGPCGEFF
ncbi:MAG TPA: hypothetical protein VGR48_18900 [Terriglobales bacterium]|nr:hypothetical protein [Terriglobales bacterium]